MTEPIATILVGLPGLGKSKIVNEMKRMDDLLFVYSTDNILERISYDLGKTYDDVFEEHIKNAQVEADDGLFVALGNKMDIVFDQTNLGVKKRKKIINRMKQAGYQVRGHCILPPEAGWLDDQKAWARRLRNRPGKTIPQHVLSNMIESFVEPTIDEGFDMITFYNMHGALLRIDYGED